MEWHLTDEDKSKIRLWIETARYNRESLIGYVDFHSFRISYSRIGDLGILELSPNMCQMISRYVYKNRVDKFEDGLSLYRVFEETNRQLARAKYWDEYLSRIGLSSMYRGFHYKGAVDSRYFTVTVDRLYTDGTDLVSMKVDNKSFSFYHVDDAVDLIERMNTEMSTIFPYWSSSAFVMGLTREERDRMITR